MTDVIARGVIEVVADASGLNAGMAQATQAVDRFEREATQAAGAVGQAFTQAGAQTENATGRMDAVTRRFIQSLEREAQQVGRTRSEYRAWRAEQLGVSTEVAPLIARLREAEKGVANMGVSAKQTAAALQGLPAQLTDIVVSLQGGQRPLTVLLQQGGQLRDTFGSVGNVFRGLASVFTPLRLAMLGTTGAVGTVIAAYMQAEKESHRFREAIILTGNAAGTTVDRLLEMSGRVSDDIGTYGDAAEALALLAESGVVASSEFEDLARAAVTANNAIGKSVEETIQQYEEIARRPTEAISKLDAKYRFLTRSTLAQIAALEREGKATEAATIATRAYAETLESRSKEVIDNLGYIEKGWRAVASAAKAAKEAVLSVGREPTLGESIEQTIADIRRLEQQIDRLRAGGGVVSVEGRAVTTGGSRGAAFNAGATAAAQAELEAARARLDTLQESQRLADRQAQRQGEQVREAERAKDQIRAMAEFQERFATAAEKADRAVAEWRRRLGQGFTPEMERMVRAQFAPKDKRDPFSGPDYTEQIQQRVGSLIEDSDVIKAQVYLDTMNALDDLFFDGAISVELYDSAMQKLTGSTSSAEAEVSKFLAEQERLAALIGATASAELERQREDMLLLAKAYEEGRISVEQYNEAVIARLGNVDKEGKKVKTLSEELGLSFSSAFEDAIVKGNDFRDVLDGIAQDLLRIVVRRQITEPLGNALTGFNWGSLFSSGTAAGGDGAWLATGTNYVPYDGFRAVLHKGEAVVPAEYNPAAGGMPAVVESAPAPLQIEFVNQGTPQKEARREVGSDGTLRVFVEDIVASSIASGGRVSKAISSTFNTNRGAGTPRRN